MSRFVKGDTVILNGHRLTVADNLPDPLLRTEDGRTFRIPPDLLPDPEPREEPEPEWRMGEVVVDGRGANWWRGYDCWLAPGSGHAYEHHIPLRPLVRLIPAQPEPYGTFRDGMDLVWAHHGALDLAADTFRHNGVTHASRGRCPACATPAPVNCNCDAGLAGHETWCESGLGLSRAAASGSLQAMRDPYRCRECDKRNPCPVHAAPAPPALTPGMTVAHRDGRFGWYYGPEGSGLGLSWRPFGGPRQSALEAELRPVTLVEKPDREAFVMAVNTFRATREAEESCDAHTWPRLLCKNCPVCIGRAVYDALFPGGAS